MKILEINSSCEYGSTGRNVLEIADYLNEHNIECHIAHTSGSHYKLEYIVGNPFINKIHALLSRVIGWQEIYSVLQTKKLIKYIEKHDFDVVNMNNIHSNYLSYPLLMKAMIKQKRGIVLTLHDCWFYTGKCTHYTKENCYKWQDTCGNCPRLKRDITSWFFDFTSNMLGQKAKLYKKAENKLAVIGVSDWIVKEAKKSILQDASILTRIYNWIDTDIFKIIDGDNLKEELGLAKEKKVLLGVAAGWTDEKGLSDFIELAKMLPSDYYIVLVGNKETELELPSNLRIVGRNNSVYELARYYNMADVFLSLSIEESFGKVVAEALACGTPVVVYNSTASPELVGDDCGYVVEAHDIGHLSDCVIKICMKDKKIFSENCRRFAILNFDKNKNIPDYIDIFERIDRN